MKKLSKIIVLLMAVALICGALVVAAYADDTKFDLAGAIDSATADENGTKTVKLEGNVDLEDTYVVRENIVIDLNGNTLTSKLEAAFSVTEGASLSIVGRVILSLTVCLL